MIGNHVNPQGFREFESLLLRQNESQTKVQMIVPLSQVRIYGKNSEETAIVMAHRSAHRCSLPVKSMRGREEVSLSIGVSSQLDFFGSHPVRVILASGGIVAPRSASFPVLAVLAVQPVDCLVQILRCMAKA